MGHAMIETTGTSLWRLLFSTVLVLSVANVVFAQSTNASSVTTSPQVLQLRQDVTALIASSGALSGNVKRHFRSANVLNGFQTPEDKVTWTVVAPRDDDYVVSVLFSKREQTKLEVSSGDTVLEAPSLVRTWEYRPFFWRQELPDTLHLKAGGTEAQMTSLEVTAGGQILEAEAAATSNGSPGSEADGFTGSGYVEFDSKDKPSAITWTFDV